MKIRCGSHQQNRSIVRPGLSLMAAKVALTAEEFRENSQRSIALFNTEKLSTNSTHVLKSAYCNSVHFCRCNLHGACGGKDCVKPVSDTLYRCNLHGACGGKGLNPNCSRSALSCNLHGACGGKDNDEIVALVSPGCNLHGACGGKVSGEDIHFVNLLVAICTERVEDLASSLEKNPRKFMQTYCIFIHFGV
jgi:hypothetical protein